MKSPTLAVLVLAGLTSPVLADTSGLALNVAESLTTVATAAESNGSFWSGWKNSVDLGLNGSDGNSQNLNVRGAFGAVRDAADMTTTFGASYVWGSSSNTTNKSHGELSLRNDWKLDEPWGLFGILKAEYDEFQRWQWRLSGAFGPSYNFIKNDTTLLKGRVGIGFSYEMGKQAEEKIVPELDIGFDWSHKFNDRTRAFASFDYYPSLDEFPEYRMVGNAGLEVALDPGSGMNLKLGVQDRYDHRAQAPTKKNDVDYFVTLGWTW